MKNNNNKQHTINKQHKNTDNQQQQHLTNNRTPITHMNT